LAHLGRFLPAKVDLGTDTSKIPQTSLDHHNS
jgi:hypothetical protein